MFVLVRVLIWILAFTNETLLELSCASFSFALQIMANLLCSCLCLFDTIAELHAMDEKKQSMTFSLESESGFHM